MNLIETIASNGPWAWVIGGLILLGLELAVPGGILVWLGMAGIITGLVTLFWPLAWPLQFLVFGALSLISIVAWLRYAKNRPPQTDRPYLNRRPDTFIGHEAVLEEPIREGFGRVALGDTLWRVAGPDLPAGRRVRIVGSDGAVLKVEAVGDEN